MITFLLLVLIAVILYFAYWKQDTEGTVWEQPKTFIRVHIPAVAKKETAKITTILFRKYKF